MRNACSFKAIAESREIGRHMADDGLDDFEAKEILKNMPVDERIGVFSDAIWDLLTIDIELGEKDSEKYQIIMNILASVLCRFFHSCIHYSSQHDAMELLIDKVYERLDELQQMEKNHESN